MQLKLSILSLLSSTAIATPQCNATIRTPLPPLQATKALAATLSPTPLITSALILPWCCGPGNTDQRLGFSGPYYNTHQYCQGAVVGQGQEVIINNGTGTLFSAGNSSPPAVPARLSRLGSPERYGSLIPKKSPRVLLCSRAWQIRGA